MRSRFILPLVLGLLSMAASRSGQSSLPPESRVIPQDSAPIKILNYSSAYQAVGAYSREGILHTVEYQNISSKTVVAIQFGLVAFDIWNEFLDRTGGVAMEPIPSQGTGKGAWVATAYADFSFHTGVAYVAKVRFD